MTTENINEVSTNNISANSRTNFSTTTIASVNNPTVKIAKALLSNNRQRVKLEKTVIEGVHLLDSAINADYPIDQVLISASAMDNPEIKQIIDKLFMFDKRAKVMVVDGKVYKDMRTLGTGVDVMAILPIKKPNNPTQTLNYLPNITEDCLILNDVQDSGNVGTLLRTAAAIGISNIICTSGTAGTWSPKTLRAGMGAQFILNIYENISIETIVKKVQVPMFATSSHTDSVIYSADFTQPVAWVMGHEGQGICDELLEGSTQITLPQPNGQESLNVAIAGSLCMYEMLRQRSYR